MQDPLEVGSPVVEGTDGPSNEDPNTPDNSDDAGGDEAASGNENLGDADADADAEKKDEGDNGSGNAENTGSELETKSLGDDALAPMAITGGIQFNTPSYYYALDQVTLPLEPRSGFTAAAGDTMTLTWESDVFTVSATVPMPVAGVPGLAVTAMGPGSATFTFSSAFTAAADTPITPVFDAVVNFEECRPSVGDYQPYTSLDWNLSFGASVTNGSVVVPEDTCPASEIPAVSWMGFSPEDGVLGIEVVFPGVPAPGHAISITYPETLLTIEPGTYGLLAWNVTQGEEQVVATVEVTTGLITYAFLDVDSEDNWESWMWIELPGEFVLAACDPALGTYVIGSDIIIYVASPGGEFYDDFGDVLCNAAPVSKSGEWVSDTEIEWTVDTGHISGEGYFYDSLDSDGMSFVCGDDGSLVTVEFYDGYGDVAGDYDVYCEDSYGYLEVEFWGEEIHRLTITFRTTIDQENLQTSYINCANVYSYGEGGPKKSAANQAIGIGGSACYELFPEGGGDFITKTVDKSQVKTGEAVKFIVTVSTSSNQWEAISLEDVLPAGFTIDPASITCSVAPIAHQGDPCFVLPMERYRSPHRDMKLKMKDGTGYPNQRSSR